MLKNNSTRLTCIQEKRTPILHQQSTGKSNMDNTRLRTITAHWPISIFRSYAPSVSHVSICSGAQAVRTVTHEVAFHVERRCILRMEPVHDHELHVLGWFPVAFPLVYEPVIYLLLVEPSWFCQSNLLCLLVMLNIKSFSKLLSYKIMHGNPVLNWS